MTPKPPSQTLPQDGEGKSVPVPSLVLEAALYVVATPIGNLHDITLRALGVLVACPTLACEDTRRARKLLARYDIALTTKRLVRYDDHADEALRANLCTTIARGDSVALLSDSGTPTLADPGMKLVRACRGQGLPVFAIPGASAFTAALSASGLPTDRVLFLGFLPRKNAHKERLLQSMASFEATFVFFESPHRLQSTLALLARHLPQRKACVFREMTKIFESFHTGSCESLASLLAEKKPRGEYTLLVAGKDKDKDKDKDKNKSSTELIE